MTHRPKSSFTLPRRNELHTSAPRKYLAYRKLIENGETLLSNELHGIYKEKSESVGSGSETDFKAETIESHNYRSLDEMEDKTDDDTNEDNVENGGDDDDDDDTAYTTSTDDKEEDHALNGELYKWLENLSDLMPKLNISDEQISKVEQLHLIHISGDCKPLQSKAAQNHAMNRVLVPFQQQNLEMVRAMSIKSIGKFALADKVGHNKFNPKISLAQQLKEIYKRRLTASELILKSVRNYWFDNMELKIENSYMHIDRYLFQYFAQNFKDHSNSFLELPCNKVPMDLMVMVYNWLIGENCEELELRDNYLAVYTLAKFLDLRRILEQFWYTFSMSQRFGFWEQNAFHAYLNARCDRTQCGDMMAILIGRMRKCFLPLVASEEFLQLSVFEVIFILKMDTLCVNSEDEMFFAAVRWLEHDWEKRKHYLVDIMATIRIRLLSAWLQRSIIHRPENNVIRYLGSNAYVKGMLWDACLFGTANFIYSQQPTESNKILRSEYNPENEVQRIWVFCPGVPHHHDIKCPRYRPLTYETFKLFLISLHTRSPLFINSIKYCQQKHWNAYECCDECKPPENYSNQKRVNPSVYSRTA